MNVVLEKHINSLSAAHAEHDVKQVITAVLLSDGSIHTVMGGDAAAISECAVSISAVGVLEVAKRAILNENFAHGERNSPENKE